MSPPPLLIGISGPSSSGKTTLSRLIRTLFPSDQAFILHLDDFYRTDAEIPIKNGVQDWDCIGALNLPSLHSALQHIKQNGRSPDWLVSKEDKNTLPEHNVPLTVTDKLCSDMSDLLRERPDLKDRRICIVDGFLLFSPEMADIRALFDVRLFLRASHEVVKERREARSGYVMLEGFWKDPPGYVDEIVWPNYVQDHRFLFEGGDVHAELNEEVCRKLAIHGMPKGAEANMEKCLTWAVGILEGVMRDHSN